MTSQPATDKVPALKLRFLSHGTLESKDLARSCKFYTEFLGIDTIRTSPVSAMIRLGGNHVMAVVAMGKRSGEMPIGNHNGLDVETDAEVDAAYQTCQEQADQWGLHKLSKPKAQHGSYSFYFWDCDDNAWEILTNPKGGYSWLFERGDQDGRGHLDKNFERPPETQT